MRFFLFVSLIFGACSGICYERVVSPGDALKRLIEGNQRYTQDVLEHPNRTSERREASRAVQLPYAVIVGCADSRVSPEIIFDEGVGDLFIVRVAGNVIGPLELESIEYAGTVLQSVVILVLGHESCGAVQAVLEGKAGKFPALSRLIGPAIKEAKAQNSENVLQDAVKDNAIHMRDFLLQSPTIGKLVREGKIAVKAGYYHLQSGTVELL